MLCKFKLKKISEEIKMNYELVDTILYTAEEGSASIKVIVDSTNITCGLHNNQLQKYLEKI